MTDEGCTGDGRGRGHTYTTAEVKVLTETASKVAYELGRKDAGEEIAAALAVERDKVKPGYPGWKYLNVAIAKVRSIGGLQ